MDILSNIFRNNGHFYTRVILHTVADHAVSSLFSSASVPRSI